MLNNFRKTAKVAVATPLLFLSSTPLSFLGALSSSQFAICATNISHQCVSPYNSPSTKLVRMSTSTSNQPKPPTPSPLTDRKNVLGGPLECCCQSPQTGFYRDGFCRTGPGDYGVHTVCAVVTKEFLEYTKGQGNDLMTPRSGFPGLKPGDKWCLCVSRWKEAVDAGCAPRVVLKACDEASLKVAPLELLKKYAVN